MKKEILSYLESIGITGVLIENVERIYRFYNEGLSFTIDDVFVSEYINDDGSRNYESLWLFNKEYCFEAKFFLTTDDYDIQKISKSILYIEIKKNDYEIINNIANEKSRLNIEFTFSPGTSDSLSGTLKASKENCKYLWNILKVYILPNIK